jgi:hypothetical protein
MGRRAGSEAHRDVEFVISWDLAGTSPRNGYIYIWRDIEIRTNLQLHSSFDRWVADCGGLIILRRAAEPEESGNKKNTSQKSQELPQDLPVAISIIAWR